MNRLTLTTMHIAGGERGLVVSKLFVCIRVAEVCRGPGQRAERRGDRRGPSHRLVTAASRIN